MLVTAMWVCRSITHIQDIHIKAYIIKGLKLKIKGEKEGGKKKQEKTHRYLSRMVQ